MHQAIELIADGDSEKALGDLNIKKFLITNGLFHAVKFDSYEIDILGKKYLIKKFNRVDITYLPSGLSTAYLNLHDKFTSAGYMAIENMKGDYNNLIFLSVEEKMDGFFKIGDFEIFKNDEKQVL